MFVRPSKQYSVRMGGGQFYDLVCTLIEVDFHLSQIILSINVVMFLNSSLKSVVATFTFITCNSLHQCKFVNFRLPSEGAVRCTPLSNLKIISSDANKDILPIINCVFLFHSGI